MKNLILPGILIGGLIAFLAAKKRAMQNLILNILDIGINSKKSNIRELVFNVKIGANNQENLPVVIKRINLNLFANQSIIANFNRSVNLAVLPNEEKEFFIEIRLNNLSAVSTIITALAAGEAPELTVKGTVLTDLGTITVE